MAVQSTYSYQFVDAGGKVVSGTMEASSAEEINARLRAEGKLVVSIDDRPLRARRELDSEQVRLNGAARGVRRDDVIAFCQQLAVMLETGVPITEAMEAFHLQTPRAEFKVVLDAIREDIHSGVELSAAMSKWPKVFPNMMISLVKASEASGTLALMLNRIGSYLAKERKTAKQIKGALGYPMFMMVTGITMTGFLMVFILPKFARIYEARSASLPLPTKILMAISDFVMQGYLIYAPVALVTLLGLILFLRSAGGRIFLDWFRLNCPVLRSMYRQLYLTRAARAMATLFSSGVGLLDIIEICRGITNNTFYDRMWNDLDEAVRQGKGMSESITGNTLFPPNVTSMISAGERSGRLPDVMQRIADFAEEELDASVSKVTSYVEPVMIITMGFVIGGIAISLLLPVFSMGRVMSGG